MVKRPQLILAVLALAAVALGVWSWLGANGARRFAVLGPRQAEAREPEGLPRIGLDRLQRKEPDRPAGTEAGRDVFRFGRPPAPAETPRPLPLATPPPTLPSEALPATPPPPPTLPPFGVKYIGTVEQRGTKIAMLLSDDKKEVLTGREGDTVANRLKIVKIGLESIEVQDVGSERVRRIPLKGN